MLDYLNPYNFVPIGFNTARTSDTGEKITGFLDCEMHLKTPLIIPDSECKTEISADHFKYEFFSIGGSPVVPASEIRGVIRNVYETVTDSCFSTSPNSPITMRARGFDSTPGLLKKNSSGSWDLYKAAAVIGLDCGYTTRQTTIQDYNDPQKRNAPKPMPKGLTRYFLNDHKLVLSNGRDRIECDNFGRLSVEWFGNALCKWAGKNDDTDKYPRRGNDEGYVLLMPKPSFGNKRYNHLMVDSNEIIKRAIYSHRDLVNILLKQLDDYISNSKDERNSKFYRNMQDLIDGGASVIPVWYREVSGKYYFGFSQQGRNSFNNTIHSLLGDFAPCKDVSKLCPACSLFGTVGDNNSAVHGKVRFCDAEYISEISDDTYFTRTLSILGSPHISASEFYFHKPSPEAKTWNCDYYTKGYGQGNRPINVSNTPRILGRKYYWHHSPQQANAETKTKMNSTFDCLKVGTFTFRVYFDGITMSQLNAIKWCLCLGENDDKGKKCHKIGHGKPLGYGSVKIKVCRTTTRTIANSKYTVSSSDEGSSVSSDGLQHLDKLLKICDLNSASGQKVSYPPKGFEWFVNNRGDFRRPEIAETLPPIDGDAVIGGIVDTPMENTDCFTANKEYPATVRSSTKKYYYLTVIDNNGSLHTSKCAVSKNDFDHNPIGTDITVRFLAQKDNLYFFEAVLQDSAR